MKKIAGIEIIFLVVVLLILILAPLNAYRISTYFVGREVEQSYIYESVIYNTPITLFILYLALYVKYKNFEYPRAYVIRKLGIPIILCLYIIAYLVGLNWDSIRNIEDAFVYVFVIPIWAHVVFTILFMTINSVFLIKSYNGKKYKMFINIYSGVLVVIYLLLFSTVVTDSASDLGLLNWDWG